MPFTLPNIQSLPGNLIGATNYARLGRRYDRPGRMADLYGYSAGRGLRLLHAGVVINVQMTNWRQ